ncbi:hypothetical protein RBB50_010505 [Rhinocladiella similis]
MKESANGESGIGPRHPAYSNDATFVGSENDWLVVVELLAIVVVVVGDSDPDDVCGDDDVLDTSMIESLDGMEATDDCAGGSDRAVVVVVDVVVDGGGGGGVMLLSCHDILVEDCDVTEKVRDENSDDWEEV